MYIYIYIYVYDFQRNDDWGDWIAGKVGGGAGGRRGDPPPFRY